MVMCPQCGSETGEPTDGLCPHCGAPLPPRRGIRRVMLSLVLFGTVVVVFGVLVGWAQWESVSRPPQESGRATEPADTRPDPHEKAHIRLDSRRVLLDVREYVDGQPRPPVELTHMLRASLDAAGFEPVESAPGSRPRDNAIRTGSASYVVCTARSSVRKEETVTGAARCYVSMTIQLTAYHVDPTRVLYVRKVSGRADDVTVEDALGTAREELAVPLFDEAQTKLVGTLAPVDNGIQ